MADKEYIEVASWYKGVANAIRSKKGTSEPILRDNFASEIESISVGSTLPYYDGTVVIEKAESVLGLRKFKSILNFNGIIVVNGIEEFSPFIQHEPNQITIDVVNIGGNNVSKLIPYHFSDAEGVSLLGIATLTVDGELGDDVYNELFGAVDIDHITGVTIDVISCGTNVEQWLLANTEGVSV